MARQKFLDILQKENKINSGNRDIERIKLRISYVTKLVERVVAVQLVNHIERHNLMEVHQSAYRAYHSTETALLKVKTDVIRALEN